MYIFNVNVYSKNDYQILKCSGIFSYFPTTQETRLDVLDCNRLKLKVATWA